jgi:hypothetical protein
LYGPPPNTQQIQASIHPALFWACVLLGLFISFLALTGRQKPSVKAAIFCLGQVIMLTAPLALVIPNVVFGDFPTIDKAGSFFYYQSDVHVRFLMHPVASLNDCGVQLIGVHMGHLWVTEFFDLFLNGYGPFNIQALLYPALAWWCAALFFQSISKSWINAVVLGMPFGLGLHIYRDLNWYTIEKAAVFLLPLFAWSLYQVHLAQDQGDKKIRRRSSQIAALCFFLTAFINWYLALVAAAGAAMAVVLSRSKPLLKAFLFCLLAISPLIVLQLLLVAKGSPGTPEMFLEERAALDHFSLHPLRWNRLELLNALHPVALVLLVWGFIRKQREPLDNLLLLVAMGLFMFSLGPNLVSDVTNPVYMVAWKLVPGFWRVAKPEVFFYGTWMCLLAFTARAWAGRSLMLAYPLMVLGWVLWIRAHPAYPDFSEFAELTPALCENNQ